MRFTTKVIPSVSGKLGIIELNHPKILHSLNVEMVDAMNDILDEWYKSSLKAVLFKSSNDTKKPVFCAGGDVKSVWSAGTQTSEENLPHGHGHPGLYTTEMFRREYILNHKMATAPIPQISLWDGIVMGGGVGISIHGKYRVATQHSLLAMPETAIGLFPDVGSMFWIPRLLEDGIAQYVALTGARLRPEDLLYTGLATHYVPSERLGELQTALVEASDVLRETETVQDVVAPVLMAFHELIPIDDCFLAQNQNDIQAAFREQTVEQIMDNLKGMNNDFSSTTLATLQKMSPTSLKVTLEGLKRGAAFETIAGDFTMEFRMAQGFMRTGSDFYEGIRAVLVDKDHTPRWKPDTLEEVTNEMVQSYFQPLGDNDLLFDESSSKL